MRAPESRMNLHLCSAVQCSCSLNMSLWGVSDSVGCVLCICHCDYQAAGFMCVRY